MNKDIKNVISSVYKASIAEELGIEKGDVLLSINKEKIEDIIEYKFFIAEEYLEVEVEKKNGEIHIYEIEKEYDEDLGMEFVNPIIDEAKSCRNKCMFCFIDQLPKGMRKTLYFKDDDSRLSFLQGNFITLTNMSEKDIEKMIKYRISPVNISVHTTNSALRMKMLNNKNAGKVYEIMKKLGEAGIEMNCQIVLCPEINDGKNLEKTLDDLKQLYPQVKSVAIVPVGLTKFREGLFPLKEFNKESAKHVIHEIENIQNKLLSKIGSRFVFLSDEFYIMAQTEMPSYDAYEGFPQIENGVGLIVKFKEEINHYLDKVNLRLKKEKIISIATGASAFEFMKQLSFDIMNKIENLKINVYKIRNHYFGESITVAGLLTGEDIFCQLKDKELGNALIIPKSMLKADEDVFLDDMKLSELEKKLNVKVLPAKSQGRDFIKKLLG